jgi:protoporphyrinogen/coproporphyrinogen III oxidase
MNNTGKEVRRVAVIGGGISGLAAAWYLQQSPLVEVHLFESSSRVGGVIETCYEQGRILELGADNFATLIPDAKNLTQELGLLSEFVSPNQENRFARVLCRGKLEPIPAGFTMLLPSRIYPILTSNILTWPAKLRVIAEWFIPARKSNADESLESFAVRRLGRQAFDRLVEPIVGGIFTADASTLSMQAALPQFWEMERKHGGLLRAHRASKKGNDESSRKRQLAENASGARYEQFMAPKQGMRWWIDSIATRLDRTTIHLNTRIENVRREGNAWFLEASANQLHLPPSDASGVSDRQSMSGSTSQFDGLCLAVPAKQAAGLMQRASANLSTELSKIRYASSAVALMVVNRDEIPKDKLCFGIVVPKCENRDILAISFTSEKYPGRVNSGEVLVRVFMGGALRDDLLGRSDAELLELAWKELQQCIGVRTPPITQQLARWPAAMPQYCVGHTQRMERINQISVELPGFALAGNAYTGVGIPQCVRSGRTAAQRILNQLGLAVMDGSQASVHNQNLG